MIDLHSHVLPGMDDGSRSVEESVQMLRESARQGVRYLAATPHFYPMRSSPEEFLRRRARALERLQQVWQPEFPRLIPGAEVYYYEGITGTDGLDRLKLEGTELLLLEMPFSAWSERMVADVLELQQRHGTRVVLAHVERYLADQSRGVWELLLENGVSMQCNAGFFLNWKTAHKALRMLRRGQVHYIASDCHNMTSRPPMLGEAMKRIREKTDDAVCRGLEARAGALISEWEGSDYETSDTDPVGGVYSGGTAGAAAPVGGGGQSAAD